MQRQGPRNGHTSIRYRAAGGILLVVHLLFVGWVTLRPLDVPWVSPANLHLLGGIEADLALGPREAVERIGGSLLLLAPLGVLLPLVGGRVGASPLGSLVHTVAAAALLSLGIELVQTGVPGQVVDVDSLLLNPLGVALVHLAVVPAARARLRRTTGCTKPGCKRNLLDEAWEETFEDPRRKEPLGKGPTAVRRCTQPAGLPNIGCEGGAEYGAEGASERMTRVRIAP